MPVAAPPAVPALAGRFAPERALARLAFPIAGGMIVETAFGTVDTVLMGHVDATALAAVGFGRLALAPLILCTGALLYGVQAIAGRHVGAGAPTAAGTAAREAVRLALWIGLPLAVVAFVACDLVLARALSGDGVRSDAATYLHLRLLGLPVITAAMALRGFVYAVGRPGVDLWLSSAALALNTVLSVWWVFGGLGVPALDVAGAALGSLVAEAFHAIAMAVWVGWGAVFRAYGVRARGADVVARRRVFRAAAPRAVQGLALAAFPGFLAVMERVGVVEAAAAQVVLNAACVFFFVGFGIGVAGGTLTAQALGREDREGARRIALATARVVVGTCASLSALLAATAVPVIAASTNDPAVRAAALAPLLAYCAFLTLDALGAAFAKLLVAAGVAVYVMLVEIVAGLCVFLPLSYLLGVRWGGGAWGVWAGFGAYILVFAGAMAWRVRGRSWVEARV